MIQKSSLRKSSVEKSNFTKFLDVTTLSRISSEKNSTDKKILYLESEIKALRMPEEPLSAEKLFENKFFNQIKQKMPHLPAKDI